MDCVVASLILVRRLGLNPTEKFTVSWQYKKHVIARKSLISVAIQKTTNTFFNMLDLFFYKLSLIYTGSPRRFTPRDDDFLFKCHCESNSAVRVCTSKIHYGLKWTFEFFINCGNAEFV